MAICSGLVGLWSSSLSFRTRHASSKAFFQGFNLQGLPGTSQPVQTPSCASWDRATWAWMELLEEHRQLQEPTTGSDTRPE